MAKTRRNKNKTCRTRRARRGGGYVSSQQYFDPDVYPPSSILPAPSTNATPEDIRPILYATIPPSKLMEGGRRKSRMKTRRGGFSPSIMGSFLANAEKAIVPLALYMAYKAVAKPGQNSASNSGRKSRRSRKGRKSRRSRR